MYQKIRRWLEEHADKIAIWLTAAVFSLWITSGFIPSLAEWIKTQNLLGVVLIALVLEMWAILVRLDKRIARPDFRLFNDQNAASKDLVEYIRKVRPSEARMVEASAATVEGVLIALRDVECKIELLVQHPEAACNPWQKNRIIQRLVEMDGLLLQNYDRIAVRLYRTPCSLRGRLLGSEMVSVGWYTYSNDKIGFYGHDNPVVNMGTTTPEGKALKKMVQRGFAWLWERDDTVRLEDYTPPG